MKKFLFLVIIPLIASGCGGTNSSSFSSEPTNTSSEPSIIQLDTPQLLQSDNLMLWNDIPLADHYEIYEDNVLILETQDNSYIMSKEAEYYVRAIKNEAAENIKDSKFSKSLFYFEIPEENVLNIEVKHHKDTFVEYSIPSEAEYVRVSSYSDGKYLNDLFNTGFVIENRSNPLTIDFGQIYNIDNSGSENAFLRYLGSQDNLPLITLSFPSGSELKTPVFSAKLQQLAFKYGNDMTVDYSLENVNSLYSIPTDKESKLTFNSSYKGLLMNVTYPTNVTSEIVSDTIKAFIFYETTQGSIDSMTVYNIKGKGDVPYARFEDVYSKLFVPFTPAEEHANRSFKARKLNRNTYVFENPIQPERSAFEVNVARNTLQVIQDDFDMFSMMSRTSNGVAYIADGIETKYCKIDEEKSTTYIPASKQFINFGAYNLDIVDDGTNVYFPLQVSFDFIIVPNAVGYIFNGKNIYYGGGLGSTGSSYQNTSPYLNKKTRSVELAEYSYHELAFYMENYYGLAKEKGCNNFDELATSLNIKEKLLSTNTKDYDEGMAIFAGKWYFDGHAQYGRRSLFSNDNGSQLYNLYSSSLSSNARYNEMMNSYSVYYARNNAGKKEGYEVYNDTLIIRFDSFEKYMGGDSGNIDVSKISMNTAISYGTDIFFAKAFDSIKNNSSIKNVVFDLSVNGGGMLDVVPFLLAFVTDDPTVTYKVGNTGEVVENHYRVDLNHDGKFDEKDTYKGKYNFFLLQSVYSFSCANYFPAVIKEKGTMTIIGQRTGGGECVVGQNGYGNASGVIYYTSGQFHLGHYDKVTQQFVGDDAGIEPDYQFDVNKFYNNSELVNFINSL